MGFDEKASSYDHWYLTPLGGFADRVETALAFELFEARPGDLILDAGCGTGNFSLKLARKGARVVGIDLSPGMLALAREKAARGKLLYDSRQLPALPSETDRRFQNCPRTPEQGGGRGSVTFALMDIYSLDFPANCFDGIVSMAAFEFIHEPRQAFAELMRVLKPGGDLLIGTISGDSAWGARYRLQAKRPGSIFRRARFMTLDELKGLDRDNLQGAGECLFIGPDTPPEKITMEEERARSRAGVKGGFIAALWQKPPFS